MPAQPFSILNPTVPAAPQADGTPGPRGPDSGRTKSAPVATVATIVTQETRATGSLDAAVALAGELDAHLDITILAVTPPESGPLYMGAEVNLISTQIQAANEDRAEMETWLAEQMKGELLRWSQTSATVQGMGLATYLTRHLRFADLVVLPKIGRHGDMIATLIEGCLFGADRPVLMIPAGAPLPRQDGRVIMAWNDGDEALSAARAAMPFLQAAALTEICIVDPPHHAPDRSDPGGALAQYLQRRGAKAEVSVMARTEESIAAILLRHAKERGADLLVAGAYGKSRLREAVFGGTTRRLLSEADLPVLFAR